LFGGGVACETFYYLVSVAVLFGAVTKFYVTKPSDVCAWWSAANRMAVADSGEAVRSFFVLAGIIHRGAGNFA
jgi:hypothetical protein